MPFGKGGIPFGKWYRNSYRSVNANLTRPPPLQPPPPPECLLYCTIHARGHAARRPARRLVGHRSDTRQARSQGCCRVEPLIRKARWQGWCVVGGAGGGRRQALAPRRMCGSSQAAAVAAQGPPAGRQPRTRGRVAQHWTSGRQQPQKWWICGGPAGYGPGGGGMRWVIHSDSGGGGGRSPPVECQRTLRRGESHGTLLLGRISQSTCPLATVPETAPPTCPPTVPEPAASVASPW